jgi:hypothetical protein
MGLPTRCFSLASFREGMMEKRIMAGLLASLSFPACASGSFFELQLRVSFRFERNSLFIRFYADTISECE